MSRYRAFAAAGVQLVIFQAGLFGQTPSSTAIIASPNPSTYGQPVTLTAMVTVGATGKVTFYDGTAILGVGTLSGTQASLTTVMLQAGNRKLRAYYRGDGLYAASSSAILPQEVVAGKSLGFRPATSSAVIPPTISMAVGDFNGDGKQDVVRVDASGSNVSVLLGAGDGTFQVGVNYLIGANSLAVTVGDFNGDGRMDIAVANAHNVYVLLGNGDGTFAAAAVYDSLSAYPNCITVGDFDGDGNTDLVVANSFSGSVSILLGKGDGTFMAATLVNAGGGTRWIAVDDFNGDGIADLAVALQYSSAAAVLLGNGDGTFQTPRVLPARAGTYSVATADLNGDGYADLIVNTGGSLGLCVLLGNGDGTFGTPAFYAAGTLPTSIAVGDFNGDGKIDVAVVDYYDSAYNHSPSSISLFPGNGDGTFGPISTFTSIPNTLNLGVVGDFNGDGKADLLLASSLSGFYSVALGGAAPDLTIAVSHGTGFTEGQQGAAYVVTVTNAGDIATFQGAGVMVTLPAGLNPTSIAGSGWTCALDTLTCSRNDSLGPNASYPPITLKLNIANGLVASVTSVFTVSGGGELNSANDSVSDTTPSRLNSTTSLNSSSNPATLGGTVTLTATVTSGATGRVEFFDGVVSLGSAYLSASQCQFATALLAAGSHALHAVYHGDSTLGQSTSPIVNQIISSVIENGAQPYTSIDMKSAASMPGIVAVDLNGDHRADLVVAYYGPAAGIGILIGNGDGSFRPAVSYGAGACQNPYGLSPGDFNNDGKPDVVLTCDTGTFLFAGNGNGTFQTAQLVTPASYYASLVVGDFNEDGNLDLAAVSSGVIVVFFGNGDGTFLPPASLTDTTLPYMVLRLADMNGDGHADLVGATSNQSVSVLLGNGDGTFRQALSAPTALVFYMTDTFVVGDFNNDGKPDVAILHLADIYVMAGNGDGTLQAPGKSSPAMSGPLAFVADIDGDGNLDIGYADNGGYISFGRGDGTFRTEISFFSENVDAFTIGDFNADGKLDFAFAKPGSGIDIYLGGSYSGLSISATHSGRFTAGKTGTYQITVTDFTFSDSITPATVTDTLPAGLTASAIEGNYWTCTLSPLSCTSSDVLNPSISFSVITLHVNVAAGLPPSIVTNQAGVIAGGIANSANDATTIVSPTAIVLTASPNPSTLGQPVTLNATVTAGATGFVYFFAGEMPVAEAAVINGTATISSRLLPSGLNSMTATYGGDATHAFATSAALYEAVNPAPANSFSPGVTFATGANPTAIAAGDFNSDGRVDLVIANAGANTVSLLLGAGDGTFGSHQDYAVGGKPASVIVADLNNDGQLDIGVSSPVGHTISVLLGNPNGTFQSSMNFPLSTNTSGGNTLAATDINGDGKVDLVTLDGYFQFLTGNGDGTFQPFVTSPYCADFEGAFGDLNRDGTTDLVTTIRQVILGNGDGTFRTDNYSYIPEVYGVAVGDLNGDGKPDLVVWDNNGVAVSLGNGDGTFQDLVAYATAVTPTGLLLADVNGDGKLDVVALGGVTNGFALLTGVGDGTLQPAVPVPLGFNSGSAVAGDFNGDGRTDLAFVGPGNNVTILLGASTPVFWVTSSHTDPFALGQAATYTLTVTNQGPGVPSSLVTVTDTLPAGLTATTIGGTGWTCTLATVSCTRSDSLGIAASYPSITVTVDVTPATTGTITNQVTVSGGGAVTGNGFDSTLVIGPPITVQTTPPGLQFTIDGGAAQIAPRTFNPTPGTHTLSVALTQSGTPGTQYAFTGWSDSGSASHSITVAGVAATYNATFKTQYSLTTNIDPAPGGSVTPASGAYFDAGSLVTLTATPNSPYVFTSWNGDVTGTTTPASLTMNAAKTVMVTFNVPGFTCDLDNDGFVTVADVQRMVNEATGAAPATHDMNRDGAINVVDIQKLINVALGSGCVY